MPSGPGQRQRDERNSATPLSANLSAYAERFGRSIKDECLDRMIIVGQASLRRAVAEYMDHYHMERNHQGSVTDSSTETSLLLRMMVRFTGAGGLVECSTSTTAKRRDVIARVFGQNAIPRTAMVTTTGARLNREGIITLDANNATR